MDYWNMNIIKVRNDYPLCMEISLWTLLVFQGVLGVDRHAQRFSNLYRERRSREDSFHISEKSLPTQAHAFVTDKRSRSKLIYLTNVSKRARLAD